MYTIATEDDKEMLEMAIVENIQRKDLNAIEIGLSYQRLIDECQLTHEDLSKKVSKDRSTISNFLRLLKLPIEIQKAVRDNEISMGHARALLSLKSNTEMINAFLKIKSEILANNFNVFENLLSNKEENFKALYQSYPLNNSSAPSPVRTALEC